MRETGQKAAVGDPVPACRSRFDVAVRVFSEEFPEIGEKAPMLRLQLVEEKHQ